MSEIRGPAEASFWIAVNGVRRRTLTCSPHDLVAVAIGHLAGEGCIASRADVIAVREVAGPGHASGIEITLAPAVAARAEALRRHRLKHGCGLRHELDCEPAALRRKARAAPAAGMDLSDLFRTLFTAAEQASPSGGLHACALFDGTTIQVIDTDVARHCAVDRVLGRALQRGLEPAQHGLLLSARLSGAMALKAALAGVGWVASRSVATSLAAEIAAAADMHVLLRPVRKGGAS